MELIDDEILFNPTSDELGRKIMWAINNQYDVLIEKLEGPHKLELRAIRRKNL